jgi:outer membrane protein TolC
MIGRDVLFAVHLLAIALAAPLRAQSVLDEYVAQGLRHNLGLRQQDLTVRGSEAAVREARGAFLPSATINARYTDVRGQVVDLGQFINPAYEALNGLLGTPAFPTDIDVRLPLKQETSVRVAQPIFQPQVIAGYRAASALRDASDATRRAAARDVVAGVRTAYLEHVKAVHLVEIRTATRALVEEHARVVAALVAAGRATPDAASRVRAELGEATQREAEAGQLLLATSQHFNLLLGRALTDSITLVGASALEPDPLPLLGDVLAGSAAREEVHAVAAARRAALAQQRAAQGSFLPTLAVAVDYGVQGNAYRFSRDADFTSVSVLASWSLFNGGRDASRVQQARLAAERLALQGADVERSIELQVRLAWQASAVAFEAIGSAGDRLAAATRTHELVRRRAEEGLATALELSEARVQLTAATLNDLITRFDYYIRRVELDRAAALAREITR